MKILIGKKIIHYRKKKNLTQEELAASVGVSPQAVSGWERECGYPDITLLPGIAHTLGITIDELMGNDEISVKEDIKQFYDKLWSIGDKEKLALATEYYHKYPEVYDLTDTLIYVLSDRGFAAQPEYLELLREAAEKIIENCTDHNFRFNAIEAMCRWCSEEEAEHWLDMTPRQISHMRGEVLESRLWDNDRRDEARVQQHINHVSLMLHAVGSESHHCGKAEISIGHNSYLRTLIRSFGEKGEVPDGWMGKYAFITMRNAAALFALGKNEEGFDVFEESLEAYKKLFELPDDKPLSLGNPGFFGEIAVVQHRNAGSYDTYVDGDGKEVKITEGYYFTQNRQYLYYTLTNTSGWEWFDSVREDERFLSAVEWAKEQAEI